MEKLLRGAFGERARIPGRLEKPCYQLDHERRARRASPTVALNWTNVLKHPFAAPGTAPRVPDPGEHPAIDATAARTPVSCPSRPPRRTGPHHQPRMGPSRRPSSGASERE